MRDTIRDRAPHDVKSPDYIFTASQKKLIRPTITLQNLITVSDYRKWNRATHDVKLPDYIFTAQQKKLIRPTITLQHLIKVSAYRRSD